MRRLNREKVLAQIRAGLKALEGILCAVLFGSLAQGKHTGTSDADLLLIIEEDLPQGERYRRYNRIRADAEVQPFIVTIEEATTRIKAGDTLLTNIICTGVPLYGEDTYAKLKNLCRKNANHHPVSS